MTIQEIVIKLLDDDPRNPNVCSPETLNKLRENIKRNSFCPTLIVRPSPKKKKRYIIVDGHHRVKVIRELGWKKVMCQVADVDELEAALLLATLNRLRGEDQPRKRAELIDRLLQQIELPDLSALLPESQTEVDDLLSLLTLDTDNLAQQIWAQQEAELAAFPVPYTFLISPEDAPVVDEALTKMATQLKEKKDRGQALVALCRYVLEPVNDKTST